MTLWCCRANCRMPRTACVASAGASASRRRNAATDSSCMASRLGVLQGQVEEHAFDGRKRGIGAGLQAVEGQRQRLCVLRKGLRLAAIDLSWELVEQQDQRQAPVRAGGPVVQFAGGGGFNQRAEAIGQVRVALVPEGRRARPCCRTRGAVVPAGPRADRCRTRTPVRPVNAAVRAPAPLTARLIRTGFRASPGQRGTGAFAPAPGPWVHP